MTRSRVLGGVLAIVVGVAVIAPGCGTSDDDGPARFGDFDGSVSHDSGADDACADAFPPCAFVEEGGAGSDLAFVVRGTVPLLG